MTEHLFLRVLFPERCQAENLVGQHGAAAWLLRRSMRALPVRSTIRRWLRPKKKTKPLRLGPPSRFLPGDWVRVLDAPAIQATLDGRNMLRGLLFVEQQWPYCGQVYKVRDVVRRILDDQGHMRPMTRTVSLEGPHCGGVDEQSGCGRLCPLFFRDEWLEPVPPPAPPPASPERGTLMRVRSCEEIEATLDEQGMCDGLYFMPEMHRHAGSIVRLRKQLREVYELNRSVATAIPVYLLEGLTCSGQAVGPRGPCHRGCTLLWHGRWLEPS